MSDGYPRDIGTTKNPGQEEESSRQNGTPTGPADRVRGMAFLLAVFFAGAGIPCLTACRGLQEGPRLEREIMNGFEERIGRISERLASKDPIERYRAVGTLRAFGALANEAVLPALADRAEIVSKAAQTHFIEQGEKAVPYLVKKIVETKEDTGLYARIAQGRERDRGKSLAGTLWLALVRGTERDRALELTKEMIRHDSPKVRAVAVFTAISTRDPRFVALLEDVADDDDPTVKTRARESLVQLFFGSSSARPGMDMEAKKKAFPQLERELLFILNENAPGFVEVKETLPELLAIRKLKQYREELVALVMKALEDERISLDGAVNCGKIIAAQMEKEELGAVFEEWTGQLFRDGPSSAPGRKLAALAWFPVDVFDAKLVDPVLELAKRPRKEDRPDPRGLPGLVLKTFEKSVLEADSAALASVIAFLPDWMSRARDELLLEIAFACKDTLQRIEKKREASEKEKDQDEAKRLETAIETLKEAVRGQADRLFALSGSAPPRELLGIEEFFLAIEDARYVDVFKTAWEHRFDEDVEIAWILGEALRPLARRKEKAVLPLILEYAEAGPGVRHTHLKDACIYSLTLGRYSAILDEFMTEERFEHWMKILRDLEEHPRFRAGFFPLLELEGLGKERKEILSGIALGYALPPHDSNLRSKAALHALLAGDRGALGPVYSLAMDRDHPWWVFHNAFSGIAAFHGAREELKEGEEFKVPVDAARALMDIMAGGLKCMESYPRARIVHVNNYYNWGIQYKIFPPEMCARVLKETTKVEEDFGTDLAKWRDWLEDLEKENAKRSSTE